MSYQRKEQIGDGAVMTNPLLTSHKSNGKNYRGVGRFYLAWRDA